MPRCVQTKIGNNIGLLRNTLEHEARFKFIKSELLDDFNKAYAKINEMSMELEKGNKCQV